MIVKKNPYTGSYYVYPEIGDPKIYNSVYNRKLPKWIASAISKTKPVVENGFKIWNLNERKTK